MTHRDRPDIDTKSPPFDHLKNVQWLSTDRSGRDSFAHARHHLYVGRDKRTNTNVLVKLAAKPGAIYQENLNNEIAALTTINDALPASRTYPLVRDHGRLSDGRVFLVTSLFDEFPLATAIGDEPLPARTVSYLLATLAVADALIELHGLPIFHVDLNPMNILYRVEKGRPVIRIVDFESAYDPARHAAGVFYNPPTTPRFSAPEVTQRPPDARADVFSLGAVAYTMLAGHRWTWQGDAGDCLAVDTDLDDPIRKVLRRAVDPDPDSRYPAVEPFRASIAEYLERIWPGRDW
jgi:serine/threonine protein kinase